MKKMLGVRFIRLIASRILTAVFFLFGSGCFTGGTLNYLALALLFVIIFMFSSSLLLYHMWNKNLLDLE